jgi:hypothetical protein
MSDVSQAPTKWATTAGGKAVIAIIVIVVVFCAVFFPVYYTRGGSTQTPCAAGEGKVGDKCVPCSPGSFSTSAGDSCTPCAAGTAQPDAGATSCVACDPKITYQSGKGQTKCKPCTICPTGVSEAKACTPTSDTQCDNCKMCPAGQHVLTACTKSKNTTCAPCPVGTASETAGYETECAACVSGTNFAATTAAKACTPCKECTGATSLQAACTPTTDTLCCADCGKGQYVSADCTAKLPKPTCTSCPVGTAQPKQNYDKLCVPCENGKTFADKVGSAQCTPCVTTCPDGSTPSKCSPEKDGSCVWVDYACIVGDWALKYTKTQGGTYVPIGVYTIASSPAGHSMACKDATVCAAAPLSFANGVITTVVGDKPDLINLAVDFTEGKSTGKAIGRGLVGAACKGPDCTGCNTFDLTVILGLASSATVRFTRV